MERVYVRCDARPGDGRWEMNEEFVGLPYAFDTV